MGVTGIINYFALHKPSDKPKKKPGIGLVAPDSDQTTGTADNQKSIDEATSQPIKDDRKGLDNPNNNSKMPEPAAVNFGDRVKGARATATSAPEPQQR